MYSLSNIAVVNTIDITRTLCANYWWHTVCSSQRIYRHSSQGWGNSAWRRRNHLRGVGGPVEALKKRLAGGGRAPFLLLSISLFRNCPQKICQKIKVEIAHSHALFLFLCSGSYMKLAISKLFYSLHFHTVRVTCAKCVYIKYFFVFWEYLGRGLARTPWARRHWLQIELRSFEHTRGYGQSGVSWAVETPDIRSALLADERVLNVDHVTHMSDNCCRLTVEIMTLCRITDSWYALATQHAVIRRSLIYQYNKK